MRKKGKRTGVSEVVAAEPVVTKNTAAGLMWLWIAMGVLVLVCIGIYVQTGSHEFVNLDDIDYIPKNPNVRAGLTLSGIRWAIVTVNYFYWQPLTWISHMIDCTLFGLNAGPHHLVSAGIHAVNSALLVWALFLLTGSVGRSAFAGALFALHPLRVESVAWAAERKDVLSGLFWILTMAAYAWYVKRPSGRRFALVTLAALLSSMSKPTVVTLPFVLLLLDFWPLARFRNVSEIWPLVKEKWALFAISAGLSVITFIGQQQAGATVNLQAMPLYFRVYNGINSYFGYLAKFLWPANLSIFYPLHKLDTLAIWEIALLLVVLTLAALQQAPKRGYWLTGWLWFLGAMVPMIGLAQTGTQSMADRFTYLPMIGLSIAASWALAELWAKLSLPPKAAIAASCLPLGLMAAVSYRQTTYWKDSLTLFEHSVAVTEDNDFLRTNLANLYLAQGKTEEAARHIEEVLRIEPKNGLAMHIAVQIYVRARQPEKALEHMRKLVALDPSDVSLKRSLADLLWQTGKVEEARQQIAEVVRQSPNDLEARALQMMINAR